MTTKNNPVVAANDRDELRAKIEAAERRVAERTLAEQAKSAAGTAADYTRKNPLIVMSGAIVVGLAIGLMTKPGRRVAKTAATGAMGAVTGAASGTASAAKKVSKTGVSRSGVLVSDAIIAYGLKLIDDMLDGARAGQEIAEDIGDSAAAKARSVRRDANYMLGNAADKSRLTKRRTQRRAGRAVKSLKNRVIG